MRHQMMASGGTGMVTDTRSMSERADEFEEWQMKEFEKRLVAKSLLAWQIYGGSLAN